MKLFRSKIVAVVLTLAMVISVFAMPIANAAGQGTVTGTEAADFLQSVSLLQGDENGNLNLDQTLVRQDAVVALSRLLGQEEEAQAFDASEMLFTDVANSYYAPYIAWAYENGYVKGTSDTTFGFDETFTAWQCQALFVRALGFDPANEDVEAVAEEAGVTAGFDGDVNAPITRENMSLLMYNTVYAETSEGTILGEDLGVIEVTPVVAPVLSDVAASATTTSADTVTITGKVAPVTATVTVAGNAATVAADGTFSAVVTLDKAAEGGINNIAVAATNDGKVDSKSVAVTYVPVPPIAVKAVNAVGESVDLAGATNMVADKNNLFTITFPEKVNKDSVTRTYIKLYEGTGLVSLAAPTVKADYTTVTVGPSDNLKDNTTYKLAILKGIKKADGTTDISAIDQEYSFTTGAANYIYALSDSLDQNSTKNLAAAVYGKAFEITFKRDLDPSSISSASMKLYDITGGTNTSIPVVNKLHVDPATNAILETDIATTDGLLTGHQYKFVLGSLKDLLGVNVALQEVYFTVGASNVGIDLFDADRSTALTSSSKVWPKLQAGSLDGTTAIKYGAKVYLRFSQTQAMDIATINANTIYLEKLDKNGVIVGKVDATVDYDATFRMASITPKADLDADTQYKLTIKKGENGIKDILGLKVDNTDTDETLTFRTLDTTAPTVSSVALKTASGNDVAVTTGMIDVDSTKQLRFAFAFNEEVAAVDNESIYDHDNYVTNLTTSLGASATTIKSFEAGKSIIVMNTTDDVSVAPTNITVSMSSDYKTIYVTAPAGTFEKAHSYAIKLAGKTGNPGSSTTTAHAICDRTNFKDSGTDAENDAMGVNRMAEMYQFSFSTADTDSVAPTVTGVYMGTTYDSKVGPVPSGYKNIAAAATNIYILFSEKMGNGTSKTTLDTTAGTLQGTNVQIQSKAVGGSWISEAPNTIGGNFNILKNGAADADHIMFTTDATKEISYLTIPATTLDADKNYRIVLTPSATSNGIEDLEGNDLANDFIYELTTCGSLVFTPVAAGSTVSAVTGTVGAIASGQGEAAAEVGVGTLTAAVNDYIVVTLDSGATFVAQVDAVDGSNRPTSFTADVPSVVTAGNAAFNYTNAKIATLPAAMTSGTGAGAGEAVSYVAVPQGTIGAILVNKGAGAAEVAASTFTCAVGDFITIALDGGALFTTQVDAVDGTNHPTSFTDNVPTAVTGPNAAFRADYIGIETVDGAMVFGLVDAVSDKHSTSFTTNITEAAEAGALIVNFGSVSSSFVDMSNGYGLKDPIAIRIDGAVADKVDLNTISSTTVKLIKVSDNTEAVTAVTAVRGSGGDALVSINPTADLAANTQYKVHVEGVKDEVGNSVAVKDAFFTTAKGDAAKIQITAVSPTASGTAAVNAAITVTFNEDMTLGTGKILASGGAALVKGQTTAAGTNALTGTAPGATAKVGLRTAAGVYLTGRLALSADGKVLTIIPDALLVANTTYVIELGTSLSTNDNSGTGGADITLGQRNGTDPVNFPLSYNFNTEEVASVNPAVASAIFFDADNNGVDEGDSLVITFNTSMTKANIPTIAGDKNTYFDLGAGTLGDATATAAWSTDGTTVTITLGASPVLIPNSTEVTVKSTATVTSVNGVQASSSVKVKITK